MLFIWILNFLLCRLTPSGAGIPNKGMMLSSDIVDSVKAENAIKVFTSAKHVEFLN